MNEKIVTVPFAEVLWVSATSISLDITGDGMLRWVPKSLVENSNWEEEMRVEIPEWFVIKEGLDPFVEE